MGQTQRAHLHPLGCGAKSTFQWFSINNWHQLSIKSPFQLEKSLSAPPSHFFPFLENARFEQAVWN